MVWRIEKSEKMEQNGMGRMVVQGFRKLKKILKKKERNGMVWRIRKLKNWNKMGWLGHL